VGEVEFRWRYRADLAGSWSELPARHGSLWLNDLSALAVPKIYRGRHRSSPGDRGDNER
jgi:hypothetical protein